MNNHQVYMRHPEEIPIKLAFRPTAPPLTSFTDAPRLGLICPSDRAVEVGERITLSIPAVAPSIEIAGTVEWCRPRHSRFELGISFSSRESAMNARMLEQLCHIERYRCRIQRDEGRTLSEEAAAVEWIERYAALFPADHV